VIVFQGYFLYEVGPVGYGPRIRDRGKIFPGGIKGRTGIPKVSVPTVNDLTRTETAKFHNTPAASTNDMGHGVIRRGRTRKGTGPGELIQNPNPAPVPRGILHPGQVW
jgi:hypothetical protein